MNENLCQTEHKEVSAATLGGTQLPMGTAIPPGGVATTYQQNGSSINCDGLGNQLNQLSHAIHEMNQVNANNTQIILNLLKNNEKKARKQPTGCTATVDVVGNIVGIISFNEGEPRAEILVTNARGPFEVSLIKIEPDIKPKHFRLRFIGTGQTVYGKIDGLSESNLYQILVKARICFNKRFSKSQIMNALYELIAPLIEESEDVCVLKHLGGWHGENYLCKGNFPFSGCRYFAGLPVMSKELSEVEMSADIVCKYREELQSIKNIGDRIMIMLAPFMGMSASLYEDWGKKLNIALNVIPIVDVPLQRIMNWFNVAKSKNSPPLRADMTMNKLISECSLVRDEVLVLDTRMLPSVSRYKKGQGDLKIRDILNAFSGVSSLEKPMAPIGMVMISNSMLSGKGMCNVILGPGSISTGSNNCECMKSVFSSYIHFLEKNYEKVESIVKNRQNSYFAESEIAEITLEIIAAFWESEGYDLDYILGTTVKKNQLIKILSHGNFDEEDLQGEFVKALRAEIGNLVCREKLERVEDASALRYNKDWLWIPEEMFSYICKAQGLSEFEDQILLKLRDAGVLHTDSTGLKRRLQCMGIRPEYYQIKRVAFNKLGLPEVLSLAKK